MGAAQHMPDANYDLARNDALPKFGKGVSLLCWAYNEEVIIEDFLRRIHGVLSRYCADFEIVVVDDCSTDRTNEIVAGLAAGEMPEIRLHRNEVNLNVGISCKRAISYAAKEFLFWQTIDWSYDITMLRTFLELLSDNDVVAGVRRAPVPMRNPLLKPIAGLARLFSREHVTSRSDNAKKALVSIINYSLIRFLFRFPLSDYQNVVFYRTELIQSLTGESASSFMNPEMLLKSWWKGASIVEVPIHFIPRVAGEAKGTRAGAIYASVTDIFRLWFKWIVLGRREFVRKGPIRRLDPAQWDLP